jgi:hypothetical protein
MYVQSLAVSICLLCHSRSANSFIPGGITSRSRVSSKRIQVHNFASKAPIEPPSSRKKEETPKDLISIESPSPASKSLLFQPSESELAEEIEPNGGAELIGKKEEQEEPPTSLGSFLLQRKQIEEDEIKKIRSEDAKNTANKTAELKLPGLPAETAKTMNSTTDVQKEFDEALQKFASDAETTIASFIDIYNQNAVGAVGEDSKKQAKPKTKQVKPKNDLEGMDREQVREADEAMSILTVVEVQLVKVRL